MIISIPTQQGMINFCLNAAMLKFLACVLAVLMLLTGYVVVQVSAFILSCTPTEFLRIVLFTTFVIGSGFVLRFLLSRKGATR